MWVVKLGGSLAYSPELPHWLSALAHTDAVIVPGGGPFADTVRDAQQIWRFDDATAHAMALLAIALLPATLLPDEVSGSSPAGVLVSRRVRPLSVAR